ncbi:LAETG motif-containing sortase-dependent surface protein [Streptomyces inusitatus]|uniref:LAETG motif-containing sortase-dependent surface protein n=1 Tax=Streptomyces inusitatus TaxID=68221 RepID=UPI00167E6081
MSIRVHEHAAHANEPRPEGNSVFSKFAAPTGRGRGIARRIAAAALTSGLVATSAAAGAGAAAADDGAHRQVGAVATLDGLKTFDRATLRANGESHPIPAGLFEMTVDGGGRLKTYCVDLHNPTQVQAKYLEAPAAQTSLAANRDAGRIRWILRNSFPQVDDLAALAKAAGSGPLTQRTAAAGTQVAIWRYSDGADVEALDPAAEKLADWLHKRARDIAEPRASLSLEPSTVSGRPGGRLGPVTVRTDADRVSLAPPADAAASGVRVTDAAGKPVTSAVNGTKVYLDVPADAPDGSATLTAQAMTSVPVGRAFISTTRSQAQILAGSSESTVSATAGATWAAKGAIPAFSAKRNCAEGGLDVTAANTGDAPFTFELGGVEHTIAAGRSRTVTVPVAEDQSYDVTVSAPGGFSESFKGVLDCATTGLAAPASAASPAAETPVSQLAPASAGGSSAGLEGDLAATGGSDATPMITGIAITLVVIGGGAIFFLREKPAPEE